MARKDVVFGVGVDTGSSVADVKALEKEMNELNGAMESMEKSGQKNTKNFKEVSKAFNDTKKELESTKAEINKLAGDMEHLGDVIGVEVSGSISKMEDRLYELALAGETNTQEFKDLQVQTAKYKKIVIETDRSIDALAEGGKGLNSALSIAEGTVAGFQAYTGVTALLGSENEELLETITKLQAAQGVLNSINVIKGQLLNNNIAIQRTMNVVMGKGTKAMKVMRVAMASIGIGLLIAGIGYLIANFSKVSKVIGNARKKFDEMGVGMKILLYPITLLIAGFDAVKGALQSLGIIDSEETKQRKKNAEERVTAIENERKMIGDRYDFEIAKAKAAGEDTKKLEQEKSQAVRDSIMEQIKAIIKLAIINKDYTDEQRKQVAELKADYKKSKQDETLATISANKKQADDRVKSHKTASDKIKEQAKAEQEALNQILMDQASVEDELYKMRLSANDLEEQAIVEKFDTLFAKAQGHAELEKQLMIQQELEISELRQGFADERIMAQNEILEREKAEEDAIKLKWQEKELADAEILAQKKKALQESVVENVEKGLNAMSSLNSLVTDIQLKKANGNAKEEEKIRKASFKRQKALQLGMAVIDGFRAITSSLAQSPIAIGPIPNPAGIASLAFAGITSAINIAKIAATPYSGGGSKPTTPSPPSLGGGAGAGASSFAISDNTSSAQTELNADGTQSGGSGQTQVVVVETDITTAVNNVAQINEIATF